jgi:hypothetical protein
LNGPLPPPREQQEAIPELVLDTQPKGVTRERERSLPPYTGLLIMVLVASLLAIGYAIYRDTYTEVIEQPSNAPSAGLTR